MSALGRVPHGRGQDHGWYRLPARHTVHTVGPVWRSGKDGERDLLASCYRRSLEVAHEAGCRTVAFPAISTGIYGYPVDAAARVAVDTVREALADMPSLDRVTFCCFSRDAADAHGRALANV